MQRAKSVDEYIAIAPQWGAELKQLRAVLKKTRLTEEVKWGGPSYTYHVDDVCFDLSTDPVMSGASGGNNPSFNILVSIRIE